MNSLKIKTLSIATIALILLTVVTLVGIAIPAQAETDTLLYQFTGGPDGSAPYSGLLLKGTSLYGTTASGGNASAYGVVYAVNINTGKETILHTFGGQANNDGSLPYGALAFYKAGYYGTTLGGGKYNNGTIYKLVKKGKIYVETVLHSFSCTDGCNPEYVTLVFDKLGNLYGTTFNGGTYGNGTVFKLASDGTLTTLHSFNAGAGDGYSPVSGVALDKKGNLYGVTPIGGSHAAGTIYEITATGVYSTLYNFTGGADGWVPRSALVLDKKGNLYGTTQDGGAGCTWGCGVLYKFSPTTGVETVLHTFSGVPDGEYPMYGALVFDKLGNIYGTTEAGGAFPGGSNVGTMYKLAPDGTETILCNFDVKEGTVPLGSVALDKLGNLFTTASGGGLNFGTVIKVTP